MKTTTFSVYIVEEVDSALKEKNIHACSDWPSGYSDASDSESGGVSSNPGAGMGQNGVRVTVL